MCDCVTGCADGWEWEWETCLYAHVGFFVYVRVALRLILRRYPMRRCPQSLCLSSAHPTSQQVRTLVIINVSERSFSCGVIFGYMLTFLD